MVTTIDLLNEVLQLFLVAYPCVNVYSVSDHDTRSVIRTHGKLVSEHHFNRASRFDWVNE